MITINSKDFTESEWEAVEETLYNDRNFKDNLIQYYAAYVPTICREISRKHDFNCNTVLFKNGQFIAGKLVGLDYDGSLLDKEYEVTDEISIKMDFDPRMVFDVENDTIEGNMFIDFYVNGRIDGGSRVENKNDLNSYAKYYGITTNEIYDVIKGVADMMSVELFNMYDEIKELVNNVNSVLSCKGDGFRNLLSFGIGHEFTFDDDGNVIDYKNIFYEL